MCVLLTACIFSHYAILRLLVSSNLPGVLPSSLLMEDLEERKNPVKSSNFLVIDFRLVLTTEPIKPGRPTVVMESPHWTEALDRQKGGRESNGWKASLHLGHWAGNELVSRWQSESWADVPERMWLMVVIDAVCSALYTGCGDRDCEV